MIEQVLIDVKDLIVSDTYYENTDRSFENREIPETLLKFLLSEFKVYGEMRSTELVFTSHERRGVRRHSRGRWFDGGSVEITRISSLN